MQVSGTHYIQSPGISKDHLRQFHPNKKPRASISMHTRINKRAIQ